MQNAAK